MERGRDRKFADSPLEGDGFELLVPRHESPRFPKHPGTIAAPTVWTSATVRISASRPRAAGTRAKMACLAAATSAATTRGISRRSNSSC